MQKFVSIFDKFLSLLDKVTDLGPLALRLVLAAGFYGPAVLKWADIGATAKWFAGMHYPMPLLNAYAAASTELSGAILLTLGLGTRLISLPLMVTMMVAILTVHWSNGFSADDGGYQIPLTYLCALLMLVVHGPGRISLDYVIKRRLSKA